MKKKLTLLTVCILLWIACGGDNQQQVVEIISPDDESIVNGIVDIIVETTGDVDSVKFYIDDSFKLTSISEPYVYSWNTYPLADSSTHEIYAGAYFIDGTEEISDTIFVTVYNGPTIFSDGFEYYFEGQYPLSGGWFEIWPGTGSGDTYVEGGISHGGNKSFRLSGSSSWVRTDGVELYLTDVNQLTYEVAVMIPASSEAGAVFGFFVLFNPNLGAIYNGVLFNFEDSLIYVRGITEENTGYSWNRDIWYSVKVVLDYDNLTMNVWLGNEQIASDLEAAPREISNVFALSTEYGAGGIVYYDDIEIYENISQLKRINESRTNDCIVVNIRNFTVSKFYLRF